MIVIVWTLAATIGAVIAAWSIYDAYRDLRAMGAAQNGRRLIAIGWIRREVIRFGIQAVWAGIGVLAIPNATNAVNPIALLLVATNVAVALNTFLDARERILLRRIING